jgi:hypothetical protein
MSCSARKSAVPLKLKDYATEIQDRDSINNSIEVAAADIRNLPRDALRDALRRRCDSCVQEEGEKFEHLLRYTFSARTGPHHTKKRIQEEVL